MVYHPNRRSTQKNEDQILRVQNAALANLRVMIPAMQNNIGLFLTKRAHLSPSEESLVEVERGQRYTFRDLNLYANRVAQMLCAQGVKRGERIAMLMMNEVEYIASYLAIAKIGAVMVPLNWRLVPNELAYILQDADASFVLFDAEFDETVKVLHSQHKNDVRTWLRIGDPNTAPDFAKDFHALASSQSPDEPQIGAEGDDLLFIMYTSGTTGHPKGVMHSHNTVMWSSITSLATSDVRYRDRYLLALPMFHVAALLPVMICIQRGCTMVLLRAFDFGNILKTIDHEKATIFLGVPAILQFMLLHPDFEKYSLASLRWLVCGAAPVPIPLLEAYQKLGIDVNQAYGLTESGGPGCLLAPEEARSKIGSTGRAFFHTEIRVVDTAGNDVPPDEPGELIIRGKHVMLGYWKKPEATAETLRNGWLYTGDIATIDQDGCVTIKDRLKDMIISGGENIYPAEIESVLMGFDKIKEVAVIGQKSQKWGESPVAVVVPKDGVQLEAEEVLAFCRDKLAKYKQPKDVAFTNALPRNPAGKILKKDLRDKFPGPAPE